MMRSKRWLTAVLVGGVAVLGVACETEEAGEAEDVVEEGEGVIEETGTATEVSD